jgi:hypothetical protein
MRGREIGPRGVDAIGQCRVKVGLAGPVSWLACLGDGPIGPSTRVMNTMSLSLSIYIYIYGKYMPSDPVFTDLFHLSA